MIDTWADVATTVTGWLSGPKFLVDAFGPAAFLAEIAEQLAWLGAALRSSPEDEGVCCCTPRITQVREPDSFDPTPMLGIQHALHELSRLDPPAPLARSPGRTPNGRLSLPNLLRLRPSRSRRPRCRSVLVQLIQESGHRQGLSNREANISTHWNRDVIRYDVHPGRVESTGAVELDLVPQKLLVDVSARRA